MGKAYHQDCFGCFECGKTLTGKCLNVNNNPYCEQCGKKVREGPFSGLFWPSIKAFIQSKKQKKTTDNSNNDKLTVTNDQKVLL